MPEIFSTVNALPERLLQLMREAAEVAEHAYAPYSCFRVGAALLLTNGDVVKGANVENLSFGLTICAERSALVAAISRYGPGVRIRAAAITNLNDSPSPPCGACRQVLAEFVEPKAEIVFPSGSGYKVMHFEALFPEMLELKLPE